MSNTILYCLLAFAAAVWIFVLYTAANRFAESQFQRAGYEPKIDHDAIQEELDNEFAPVSGKIGARV